jgi:uncharacterized membrane protein (DUF106 family)
MSFFIGIIVGILIIPITCILYAIQDAGRIRRMERMVKEYNEKSSQIISEEEKEQLKLEYLKKIREELKKVTPFNKQVFRKATEIVNKIL